MSALLPRQGRQGRGVLQALDERAHDMLESALLCRMQIDRGWFAPPLLTFWQKVKDKHKWAPNGPTDPRAPRTGGRHAGPQARISLEKSSETIRFPPIASEGDPADLASRESASVQPRAVDTITHRIAREP